MMVVASVSAIAFATAFVPCASCGFSKTPIGPFQTTVFALFTTEAKSSCVLGPMSRPSLSAMRRKNIRSLTEPLNLQSTRMFRTLQRKSRRRNISLLHPWFSIIWTSRFRIRRHLHSISLQNLLPSRSRSCFRARAQTNFSAVITITESRLTLKSI